MARTPFPLVGTVPTGQGIYLSRHIPIFKFGKNEDVDSQDGEVLLWSVGTTYPYQTTAQSLELTSSSVTDTGQDVIVQGLDENWDLQKVTVTTNGTGTVALPGSWIRVYRMAQLTGTINTGDVDVQVASGGSVLGRMPAGDGASFLGLMPIPAGYEGYIYRLKVSTTFAQNSEVIVRARYRDFGGPFRVVDERSISRDSADLEQLDVPFRLQPKSDIAFTAEGSGVDGAVYVGFTIVLVPISG